jgi:hypothetical protein
MVATIVFVAAMLIFVTLFSQTIQTAFSYQQHSALATKASDLLDNILLNPGYPYNWSKTDISQPSKYPTRFGVQDPEFVQYKISPFSLMRLYPSSGTALTYQGQNYCNNTVSRGCSVIAPISQMINYSQASKMLGLNGSYGFSLTVAPTIDVSISEVSFDAYNSSVPLGISVNVTGQGFVLAKASVKYCLITVTGYDSPGNPSLALYYGTTTTDDTGSTYLNFSSISVYHKSYAILVFASLSGINGVGYSSHSLDSLASVVPLISGFESRSVVLAHSYSVNPQGYNGSVTYNATFLRSPDMLQTSLNCSQSFANGELHLDYAPIHSFDAISMDPNTLGVLVVAYSRSALNSGVVILPWGFGGVNSSVTFGSPPNNQNWVSNDIRQVLINGLTYQAKFALWATNGVTS